MIKLKSLLLEELYEYFYHATKPESLPNIVSKGLLPSTEKQNWGGDLGKHSEGKMFVTDSFNQANYYGNILWRNDPDRYKPILRFKYNKLRFIPDKRSPHDFYLNYPIKTKFEIFVYDYENIEFNNKNGIFVMDERSGIWRILTMDIAKSIETGEWDNNSYLYTTDET